MEFSDRTALLIGRDGVDILAQKRVAVFGVGGVGGFVCEGLARSGIGALTLFDGDVVALSNCNRQLVALRSTLGLPKVDVMAARIADINPGCRVQANQVMYLPGNADAYPLDGLDYVVDAVDTVSAKLEIICRAKAAGVRVISAMGAGNKLDAAAFRVADIAETSVCPLARVMRKELGKRGVEGVKVVYSPEPPLRPKPGEHAVAHEKGPQLSSSGARPKTGGFVKPIPGSAVFTAGAMGLVLAGEVVHDLLCETGL